MHVRLVTKTIGVEGTEYFGKTIDEIVVGIARVSSGRSPDELFDEPEKLLRHCISNGHWSIFGEANLGFEIITDRGTTHQLLRHWTFKVQEFSQRYAEVAAFENLELRQQAASNRQSSTEIIDIIGDGIDPITELGHEIAEHLENTKRLYHKMLRLGIAKESARGILPNITQSRIILNGGIREWITFLNQRLHKSTQKECREVAQAIRDIFIKECPIISSALYNFENANEVYILNQIIQNKSNKLQLS